MLTLHTKLRAIPALLLTVAGLSSGLTLRGQTVLLGNYNGVTIPGDVSIAANTSATFTNGANFTGANASIGGNGYLYWSQDGTLTGKAFTMGSGGSYGIVQVGTSNTLTLDNATSFTGDNYLYGTTGATLINQGTISQTTGNGYIYAPTFTNQGSISVGTNAQLQIGYNAGETTTNASGGTITADGSNAIAYIHSISNQGTITAQNGGLIYFNGSSTTAGLGNVQIGVGGGHTYLNGTLDNTAATLLAPTGGVYELYGGTITNGTIAAGALSFTGSNGTLSNVSLTGNLNLAANTYVTFTNGTSFTGSNATIGANAYLYWNQNATMAGKTVTLGGAGTYGVVDVGSGNTLTLDSASSLTGDMYVYGNAGSTIINQGSISQTNGTGYIYAPTFTNQGSITVGANSILQIGYNAGETTTNASGGTITADGGGAIAYVHSISNQGTLTAQNGGDLIFTGSTTTAGLGNVQIGTGGGHAYLSGTVDNTAATFVAPTGGIYELYGGTISNGTIAAGALGFTSNNGTLSNVTFTGNLNLAANTYVTFTNGTTFTGASASIGGNGYLYWNQSGTIAGKAFTMGTAGSYGLIDVGSGDTLTLDSATTLTGDVYVYGNSGSSVTNQGAISQTNGTGYLYAPSFTNQGSISVGAGAVIEVGYNAAETTTNASGGTITSNGSGAIAYLHNISNQGTLTAQNGGELIFTGSSTTAGLGNVQIGTGGGHAYLSGTLDNTAATLTAPGGGTYELYSGTINNGTIAAGALTFTNQSGTLSNVSLTGNLAIPDSTYVIFTNGTSFTGASGSIGANAYLYWNQNGTLASKALTMGTGSGYGIIDVGSGDTLTFDSATTLSGNIYVYGNTGATITNQGTINQTSGTGYFYATTLSNQGAITAGANSALYIGYNNGESTTNAIGGTVTADGAAAAIYLHNFLNQGTVTAQNGGSLYFAGSTTTAGLGTVQIGTGGGHAYIYGTVDNTAATLTAPSGGVFELDGGTITNGTIAAGALSFTVANGTLSNVSYTGNLTLPANTSVTFTNGTAFTGASAAVGDYSYLYWNQNGSLSGKTMTFGSPGTYSSIIVGANNSLTLDSATTLTGGASVYGNIGSTITNQGSITETSTTINLYAPTFINQGAITAAAGSYVYLGNNSGGYTFTNTATGSINVTGGTANLQGALTNAGVINVQSGAFVTNNLLTNGTTGTIMGAGTINGSLIMAGGFLSPGNAGIGTLTFASTGFTVVNPSTLNIELGGTGSDELIFQNPTAVVNIGAGLLTPHLTLLSAPIPNTIYNIVDISSGGSGISGYFVGLPASGSAISASYLGTPYDFTVTYLANTISFESVPEPGTAGLLGTGLAVLAISQWRRRRSRT